MPVTFLTSLYTFYCVIMTSIVRDVLLEFPMYLFEFSLLRQFRVGTASYGVSGVTIMKICQSWE